jgi:hypothetical protein
VYLFDAMNDFPTENEIFFAYLHEEVQQGFFILS